MTLPVVLTDIDVPVIFRDKKTIMPWPILLPSSWLKVIFEMTNGQVLFAGHAVNDVARWKATFTDFWAKAGLTHGEHDVFVRHGGRLENCVPILLHGDEGRGKLRRAVMCTSFQPLLKVAGHTFLSRFLFSILPGELYCGDDSLETLHDALVGDLKDLYEHGMTVTCLRLSCILRVHAMSCVIEVKLANGQEERIFLVLMGVKGDWVYLRNLLQSMHMMFARKDWTSSCDMQHVLICPRKMSSPHPWFYKLEKMPSLQRS